MKKLLDTLQIASPCNASWEEMKGDERVRHCGLCKLNVYNLSAMNRNEAESLIRSRGGDLCGRLYQRSDGTVLTKDCPEGRSRLRRRKAIVIAAIAGAVTGFLGLIGVAGSGATSGARLDPISSLLRNLYPSTPRQVMGRITCPPPQTVTPPSGGQHDE